MKKVLDNSVISSMGKEIECIGMLDVLRSQYDIVLAGAVLRECRDLGDEALYSSIKDVPVLVERDEKYIALVDAIQKLKYQLGPGEVESIATSILLTQSGVDNFVVIDERLARSIVANIHLNPIIRGIIGSDIPPVKCAGTIGVI